MDDTTIQAIKNHKTLLLDVRSAAEFASQKSPYASNLDVQDIARGAVPNVDTSTPIVVFCRSGSRAELAKQVLTQKGFTHVINAGGYTDLPQELRD